MRASRFAPRRAALLAAALLLNLLAAAVLGAVPGAEARLRALREGDVPARREALSWLAQFGDASAVEPVVARLRDPDPAVRELAEAALWAIWSRSGDPETDRLLEAGGRLLAAGRLRAALGAFERVVRRRPDFAEGYNKRATVLYHLGDYEGSLADIAETLRRNPHHFGALSGAGLCLVEQERPREALLYFERALEINPNLRSVRVMAEQLRRLTRGSRVDAPGEPGRRARGWGSGARV